MSESCTVYKRPQALRQQIEDFVGECLQAKLIQLSSHQHERRSALIKSHQIDTWLDDAARHVKSIQLATHTTEPPYVGSRSPHVCMTNKKYCLPWFVGTHSLDYPYSIDAIGPTTAADVLDFLNLAQDGKTFLQRILADDLEVKAAFSADKRRAQSWRDSFALALSNTGRIATSVRIRQVRFRILGGEYHNLLPLFPTALVHRMHQIIFDDHFSEVAVAARRAHKKREPSSTGYREYPDLVIRNLGRSKSRNGSLLNRKRHGENWLLPSLPPPSLQLQTQQIIENESLFDEWLRTDQASQDLVQEFCRVIPQGPGHKGAVREVRRRLTAAICDEALQYALRIRNTLPPNWSKDPHCHLPDFILLWLDPRRAKDDMTFRERRLNSAWPRELASHLAEVLFAVIQPGISPNSRTRKWKRDLLEDLENLIEILEHDRD
ncbi:type I-F CRISPR-associated protein Csy1 [Rhodanobacter sp. Col0626]|uniref:type I-F CRISPR-associated protein Csy1 n=1 Tax=Rhodanobacter sp. Col0626 TaxID=3415679 RepID=UPI003CF4C633